MNPRSAAGSGPAPGPARPSGAIGSATGSSPSFGPHPLASADCVVRTQGRCQWWRAGWGGGETEKGGRCRTSGQSPSAGSGVGVGASGSGDIESSTAARFRSMVLPSLKQPHFLSRISRHKGHQAKPRTEAWGIAAFVTGPTRSPAPRASAGSSPPPFCCTAPARDSGRPLRSGHLEHNKWKRRRHRERVQRWGGARVGPTQRASPPNWKRNLPESIGAGACFAWPPNGLN